MIINTDYLHVEIFDNLLLHDFYKLMISLSGAGLERVGNRCSEALMFLAHALVVVFRGFRLSRGLLLDECIWE